MVFAGERYYNIYRVLLTTLGLWPYRKPLLFQTAFFFGVFSSFIFFQFTTFLTRTCNFEFIIRELSFILPSLTFFSTYNLLYFNTDVVKQLFEEIKADWNAVEEVGEIKILERYAFQSYLLTLILTYAIGVFIVVLITLELGPVVLDIVAPMNESRPRTLKVDFELFIDEERYFYVYVIYDIVSVLVTSFTIVASGTMLLAFLRHSCANYKIASNLLENIVTEETLKISSHEKIHVMYQRISRAVRLHKRSTQFSKFLVKSMNKWLFIMTGTFVLSLSCNLLRFYKSTMLQEMSEMLLCLNEIGVHCVILFLGNFIGQSVTDHSTEIFHAAYRTTWYLAPVSIQKLLLFMMQYTSKGTTVQLGGVFVASLEGFSTLVTTSLSYFTMIHSVN